MEKDYDLINAKCIEALEKYYKTIKRKTDVTEKINDEIEWVLNYKELFLEIAVVYNNSPTLVIPKIKYPITKALLILGYCTRN